jgi:molybdopterin converting factor small subunit
MTPARCIVNIASPLRSYTAGAAKVNANGTTVAEVLADLEQRSRGMRFRIIDEQDRIRPHICLYIGTRRVKSLSEPIAANDELHVICALSGG